MTIALLPVLNSGPVQSPPQFNKPQPGGLASVRRTLRPWGIAKQGFTPLNKGGVFGRLRQAAFGAACLVAFAVSGQAQAAGLASPEACKALQAKFPKLKGKTLVNAINPHTPGYETIDPNDPSKYIGFDIDLGEAIGDCLGFKMTYKPVAFAALLTTLQSGQADIVISDIYATEERAKAADFITYSKVFDGVLVAKGNAIDYSLNRWTALMANLVDGDVHIDNHIENLMRPWASAR